MAMEQGELKRIADDLDRIIARLEPPPTNEPVVAYRSGQWKLRDGTMYGR